MDLVTITEEILNGKLNFFVQCIDQVKSTNHIPLARPMRHVD